MDPILNSYFGRFKTTFEIGTSSSQIEAAKQSESQKRQDADAFEQFVNYIMFSLDDPDVFTSDPDLLEMVSIGGALDTGIDGLGIRLNGHLVGSTTQVDQVAEASKKLSVEFIFIQSKNRVGLDVGEFQKFAWGIRNFLSEGFLPENEHLTELREVKRYILSNEKIISKLDKLPSLYIYYVSVGAEPSDSNFEGARSMLESDLSKGYYDYISIKAVGGTQLGKYCRELENKFEKSINIKDIFPLIVNDHEKVSKAYAFTCGACEFLHLLEKDDGQLRRSLFNDNVRDYLGNRGSINHEIEKTIIENPELFLLRNNGVTIVCSDFKQVRDKLVTLENPQIVNGCQTSNSIYRLREHPNIERVQLLVRVISTDDLAVSNSIVRGTNKQNQVLDEAFEATLPFHQEQLEPFFLAAGDGTDKIYYERRSKQYNDDPMIKRSQIVNLRVLTQTFVSVFLQRPHESVRHEAKLLELYGGEAKSRSIFRDDHSPEPYYVWALVYRTIERALKDNPGSRQYLPYRQHLCYAFCRLVEKPPSSLKLSRALAQYCAKIKAATADPEFQSRTDAAVKIFDGAMSEWLRRGRSRYGIKDSKDFTDLLQAQFRDTPGPRLDIEQRASEVGPGKILRMIWKDDGHWFGFIRRGPYDENLYFDNRAYSGDLTKLVPGTEVTYELDQGTRANRVELVDERQ